MPNFGRYKTVRELYRLGFITVFSGITQDNPEEKFAIKAFQVSAMLFGREQGQAEPDLFLNSASVQQKVSSSGAQYWAPIYEYGQFPEGAYYVTNRYDHSLQQLIDGHARLTVQTLYEIIESVVKGLIELKQACSRPHGNLKAANVLITGTSDLTQTRVALTDPLPDEFIDTEVHWDTDLRAVAEFIYQLVMYRPAPVVSGWQAPETQEWAKLGRQANDWRTLCNRLLNASARPGTMTLESLLEELSTLKAARAIPTYRYIIAAGLLIAVCAVIYWFFFHKPPPPPQLNDWNMLCSEYLDWAADLHKALGLGKGNTRSQRWGKDPDLAKISAKIKDAAYPDTVAKKKGKTVEDLKDLKSEEEIAGADARKTEKGISAVKEVKSFLDPNSDKVWPLLRQINEDTKDFSAHGWQQPAAYLGNLVDAVNPRPGNKTIAENVDRIIELHSKGIAGKIRTELNNIAKYRKTITDSGDPILVKFNDGFIDKQAASGLGGAGEDALKKLGENLGGISNCAGQVGKYIEGEWQTAVDREEFKKDHGNDGVEIPTIETFTKRLETIKEYHKLVDDPRKKLNNQIAEIEGYIKEGRVSNPAEAAACAGILNELMPNINEIRSIKGIAKNEKDIIQRISQYEPELGKLRDRALRARELPRDYVRRIEKETLSTVKSDKIIEKWTIARKTLLQNYPLSKIEQNMELYSQLRGKIDEVTNNLVALDEELQAKLPVRPGIELGEKGWHQGLRQTYEREQKGRTSEIIEKIPVKDNLPDINEDSFKDFRSERYSDFVIWNNNFTGIVKAFDAIENGLELYYSLDENLPQVNESISSLWEKQKDGIQKDRGIRKELSELITRIEKLEEVRKSDDRQKLSATSLDPKSLPEAIFAAWDRLGSLSNPQWPDNDEERENDKKIQESLKSQFITIKGRNEPRGEELLKMLAAAGDKREKVFLTANIGRYRNDIVKNSYQDQTLLQFDKLKPPDSDLSEIKAFEVLAKRIADFVTSDDWQNKKFRTDLLVLESETVASTKTFENWLEKIKEYRIIEPDPRYDKQYTWQDTINDIRNGLADAQSLEDSDNLRVKFDELKPKIDDILALPAIVKNRDKISGCDKLWDQLQEIRNKLKPEFCKYLQLKNGQVILDPRAGLDLFEPVTKTGDDKFSPLNVAGWKEVKTGFFFTTEKGDNMGWPEYIRLTKDLSVILAFVPADRDNPVPFYMAIHETTNAQYCLFLNEIGATDSGKSGDAKFVDNRSKKTLISCLSSDVPGCAVKFDKSKSIFFVNEEPNRNAPVTWVSFNGASTYARWLNGQLPTAAQFEYACRAGTDTIYPWGNDLARIGQYAHVRGVAWQDAAKEYNASVNSPIGTAPCPIGAGAAKKEMLEKDNTLDTTKVVYTGNDYKSPWPIATNTKPNNWGLCDTIGNVWELCLRDENGAQTVICGGSCLADKADIAPNSKYDFKGQDCDVGFRVVVKVK
jgi:formylglycine-generating enzyme required for sulfatase activity